MPDDLKSVLRHVGKDIEKTLAQALSEAEASGSIPTEWLFDDVYADVPDFLNEQRKLL